MKRAQSHHLSWTAACAVGVLLASLSCTGITYQSSRPPEVANLPEFVGTNRSPAGTGVDLCLHSEAIRRNPHGNPQLAWDSENCFTIMGHGLIDSMFGPAILDERSDPVLMLSPSALSHMIKDDPSLRSKLSSSQHIVIYACESGTKTKEGMPSFAARLANRLNKPVIAPTEVLTMNGGRGAIAGKGTYQVFYPR